MRSIPVVKAIGAEGAHVKQLQGLLKEAGVYDGSPTALFDKATKEAVRQFQVLQGIPPDGVVGHQTLFLLYLKADRLAVPNLVKQTQMELR